MAPGTYQSFNQIITQEMIPGPGDKVLLSFIIQTANRIAILLFDTCD